MKGWKQKPYTEGSGTQSQSAEALYFNVIIPELGSSLQRQNNSFLRHVDKACRRSKRKPEFENTYKVT